MALTLPALIRALRDEVLTDLLGVYAHETNAALNVPAITVGPGSPAGYTVTGLEVAVQRQPEDNPSPLLGDGHINRREWVVTLKAWDSTANIGGAVAAITRRWPHTDQPSYVPETDRSIPQAIVRIPEPGQHWEAVAPTGGA